MVCLNADVSPEGINQLMQNAADQFPGLISYTTQAHASIDFNHNPHSAIIDGSQTRVSGSRVANLMVWFDNEWGFASRLLDVVQFWAKRF